MVVLFRGGPVVSGALDAPPVRAIAVRDGRVIALGDDALGFAGGRTRIVELDGRCVTPGFRDGHVHPLWGGIEAVGLPLASCGSVDEVLAAVQAYATAHPDEPWIVGGGYAPSLLPGGIGRATVLDVAERDRPVVLHSTDHHAVWCNSAALTAAGIDRETPDPPLGAIVRDGAGDPVGTLLEWGAIDLVERLLPEPGAERIARGLARGMHELVSNGIVWAQDAAVRPADLAAYRAADSAGVLPCRVNAAHRIEPATWSRQREAIAGLRSAIAPEHGRRPSLTANTVKFFADGVIEAGTGFLLEPYEGDDDHDCGLPNWSPGDLAEAVRAFDADGLQIHVHAIGDGGVRMALDAIEHAILHNGPRDRRPVIAHTQLVHPVDRDRFAALGVIANFEPLWACLDPVMEALTLPRLGPARSALQYPIATMLGLGARVSFGSDWPVSPIRPLDGLAVAVTRRNERGDPVGGWLPDERVPMGAALAAYTAGSAHQAFDDDAGTLAVGQMADLCVLDHDITALAGEEITGAAVDETWIAGEQVFARS